MTSISPLPALNSHKFKRAGWWFGLVGALSASWTTCAQFAELEVEIQFGQSGRNSTFHTRCVVGTNAWRMDGQFIREIKSTWWFTGTNLNEVQTWMPGNSFAKEGFRSSQRLESRDGNPGRPTSVADLLNSAVARIAWLAYCSSPAFRNENCQLFPPSDLWKMTMPPAASTPTNQFELFPDAFGLPRSLGVYTTNNETLFHYRVDATTNLLGATFPTEFALTQYRLPSGEECKWQTDFYVVGKLKSIRAVPELPFPSEKEMTGGQ